MNLQTDAGRQTVRVDEDDCREGPTQVARRFLTALFFTKDVSSDDFRGSQARIPHKAQML